MPSPRQHQKGTLGRAGLLYVRQIQLSVANLHSLLPCGFLLFWRLHAAFILRLAFGLAYGPRGGQTEGRELPLPEPLFLDLPSEAIGLAQSRLHKVYHGLIDRVALAACQHQNAEHHVVQGASI